MDIQKQSGRCPSGSQHVCLPSAPISRQSPHFENCEDDAKSKRGGCERQRHVLRPTQSEPNAEHSRADRCAIRRNQTCDGRCAHRSAGLVMSSNNNVSHKYSSRGLKLGSEKDFQPPLLVFCFLTNSDADSHRFRSKRCVKILFPRVDPGQIATQATASTPLSPRGSVRFMLSLSGAWH
jgi:hypothetical protein